MSEKQWKRWDVMERLKKGELTMVEAAKVLGLSERWVREIKERVEDKGKGALLHGNAGRAPWNRLKEETRERIVDLGRGRYAGFNDQHFTEKLVEVEKVKVSRASVQRILRAAGIGAARRRRPPKHRRRRDRKAQAGMMVLWDGSRHDWLEGRGPMLCLMATIDDATGEVLPGAHFVEQECAAGYLRLLRETVEAKGVPLSVYCDRHGSLKRNDDRWSLEEELRGEQDPTQVGRALKALAIEVIYALSPQAKGRVERLWGTLQDRLISELRLAGARTREEAEQVLAAYLPQHNRKFQVAPREAQSAWRPLRPDIDLARVCSFFYERTVGNDNAIRLEGRVIDIPPGPGGRSYAKVRVEVRQLLDGSWRVYLADRLIATAPASEVTELRALRPRKRSAASRAFRKAVQRVAASLP